MSLFLSPITPQIKTSLDTRQKNTIKSHKGWYNKKTPWIRFTSMASINGNETMRKNYMLFSGQNLYMPDGLNYLRQTTDRIYGKETGRPRPGITGISVQNKGAMGSTREATINFICWTVDQLTILEQLYMSFGVSCLLEWGWNMDINGNTVNQNLSLLPPMFDSCATKKIIKNVKDTGGHYDAMQGPVSAFTWNLRADGGFDCSTTIISMAEMFLEIETHSTSKGITKSSVDTELSDGETEAAISENILATLTTTARLIDEPGGLIYDSKMAGWRTNLEIEKDNEDDFFHKDEDINYWVTWDYLENVIINENLFFTIDEASNDCGDIENDTDEEEPNPIAIEVHGPLGMNALIDGDYPNKNIHPQLNNSLTLINYDKYIISSNPSICILPFDKFDETYILYTDAHNMSKLISNLPSEMVADVIDGKQFLFKKILINLQYFYETYKSTKTLNKLLTKILEDVSNVCGGYWDFGLQIDEDKPTEIKVVDFKTVTTSDIQPFIFKTYKVDSILKSVSINTEVTEKIKSMMMLGTNRNEDNDSAINQSSGTENNSEYNFYGNNVTNMASRAYKMPEPSKFDINLSDVLDFKAKKWEIQDYIDNIKLNIKRVYGSYNNMPSKGLTTEKTEDLRSAVNKYVSDVLRPEGNGGQVAVDKSFILLPLKLNFSLDGIGGLKFGNVVHIDYLPKRYLNNCYFQITNVSHNVSTTEWTTDIETIMRVNMIAGVAPTTQTNTTRWNKQTQSTATTNFVPPRDFTDDELIPPPDSYDRGRTTRNLMSLHPDIRNHAIIFVNRCIKSGYKICVTSAYRTIAEQDTLYAKGRTTSGGIVTHTKGGYSYHNYALALDTFENYIGNDWYKNYNKIAPIAEELGFEWGGRWRGFVDKPHFQMTMGYTTTQLKEKISKGEVDANGYAIL